MQEPLPPVDARKNELVNTNDVRLSVLALWCQVGTMLIMIYFTAIVIFAYTIFPFIPETKGGGDYSTSPIADFWADEEQYGKLILLYRTDRTLYFAKVEDNNGPCEWRSLKKFPNVIEIAQHNIKPLSYSSLGKSSITCGFE